MFNVAHSQIFKFLPVCAQLCTVQYIVCQSVKTMVLVRYIGDMIPFYFDRDRFPPPSQISQYVMQFLMKSSFWVIVVLLSITIFYTSPRVSCKVKPLCYLWNSHWAFIRDNIILCGFVSRIVFQAMILWTAFVKNNFMVVIKLL